MNQYLFLCTASYIRVLTNKILNTEEVRDPKSLSITLGKEAHLYIDVYMAMYSHPRTNEF